ncbi:MAG: hypothetical protein KC731_00285 [Myxococcales bacterium]|nr:hypothetical protein [Myxococcales bacterium]
MNSPIRIASRRAYFEALTEARREVHRSWTAEPKNPAWPFAARLLDTMADQTAHGREPTREERRAQKLGALVDRELEPAPTEEAAALNQLLKAVNLYFIVWPEDGVDPEEMPEDEFLARL